jgi:hypothetical protein
VFTTYEERMRHRPEELDIVEWHYLVLYFGTEDFQVSSRILKQNSHLRNVLQIMLLFITSCYLTLIIAGVVCRGLAIRILKIAKIER